MAIGIFADDGRVGQVDVAPALDLSHGPERLAGLIWPVKRDRDEVAHLILPAPKVARRLQSTDGRNGGTMPDDTGPPVMLDTPTERGRRASGRRGAGSAARPSVDSVSIVTPASVSAGIAADDPGA
jgi:hypothetical protein